jgi:hypothetical protein
LSLNDDDRGLGRPRGNATELTDDHEVTPFALDVEELVL